MGRISTWFPMMMTMMTISTRASAKRMKKGEEQSNHCSCTDSGNVRRAHEWRMGAIIVLKNTKGKRKTWLSVSQHGVESIGPYLVTDPRLGTR